MILTFTPGPDSRARVVASDDPQPEGSWAEGCGPSVKQQPASDAQAILTPCAAWAASDSATSAVITPLASDTSDFLGPLAPFACPDCLDRSQLLQARQQAGYWRSRFTKAKQ